MRDRVGAPLVGQHASGGNRSQALLFGAFLALCLILGGSSRNDVITALPVRLAALAVIGVSLMGPVRPDLRPIRVPLALTACLALWMLLQLIPLDPYLWRHLPGREAFVAIATAAGQAKVWRPISMTPDLTLNALLGLLPGVAALLGAAALGARAQIFVLGGIVVGAVISGLVGLTQMSLGAGDTTFYLYSQTNLGDPVGFFANRNHQATLEATAMPVALVLGRLRAIGSRDRISPVAMSYMAIAFLGVMLIVGGSRAGLVAGLFGLIAAAVSSKVLPETPRPLGGRRPTHERLRVAVPFVGLAGLFLIAHLLDRDQALQRLVNVHESMDERYTLAPSVWRMSLDLFPVGAGFGSFDAVYRTFEPTALLAVTHYNHAHDDLLEWVYEGGLPNLLFGLALLAWIFVQAWRAWRTGRHSSSQAIARLGAIMMAILIFASAVDYPLRTPSLSVVLALSLNWLSMAGPQKARQREAAGQ